MNRKERRAAKTGTGGVAAPQIGSLALQFFQRGLQEHQRGLLAQAEISYRQAINLEPGCPEFFNNLGLVLQALGNAEEAAACHRQAIALKADMPEAHFNLGIALAALGRADEAMTAYRHALPFMPNLAEIHHNLGNALRELGRLDEAAACYRRAIALKPDYAPPHTNLGAIFRARGNSAAAAASLRRAAELSPDAAEAWNNLGLVLYDLGDLEAAVAAYRRAIALRADHADAHNNLGVALQASGDSPAAIDAYRHAIAAKPDHAGAYNNLGVILQAIGRPDEALAAYRQAIALKPREPEAFNNLGLALQGLGRLDAAAASYRQAAAQRSDFADAVINLAFLRKSLCDWNDLENDTAQYRALARAGAETLNPLAFIAFVADPPEQLHCARTWASAQTKGTSKLPPPRAAQKAKLHLGYLSADLRQHPVTVLAAELFERHDRSRFEVSAYSYGPDDGSAMRRRLQGAFDRFVDIQPMSYHDAAQRIRADGVDILVDLTGHTKSARPSILAARPAPVQVNFLGFPGTMGAAFIDYVIADASTAPMRDQPFFDERIVHLPDCYMPSDTRRDIADRTPTRAECGLPESGMVFCCFNNSHKLAPITFDVWMRLLLASPGSVLWLADGSAAVKDNLGREATARGVGADRLVFAPRVPSLAEHLARHRLADLFLDTLPYNAHTTASDALWAGLPVLTCAGDAFAGRVAASLLRAVGLPELVTRSLAEYEALAMRLATDTALLQGLRRKLAANRATAALFDIVRYTRNLEAAYLRMWQIWTAGTPPEPFAVSS